jgi:HlyD family secretion protein
MVKGMKYFVWIVMPLLFAACSGNNGKEITSSGVIEGTDVNIGVEVSGHVEDIRVEEGSRVKRGDTLALIDDTEYQIQLREAAANMGSFDAAYKLAVEGPRREDIVQADANYKIAEADYNRMKELLQSQTITQKQYDDVYGRYVSSQQTMEKLHRGSRPEEIIEARQKRDYAAAQVDLLKKKIRDCSILAPSGGVLTLKGIEVGELVTAGMNILRLTYLDTVKLMIYVNEMDVGRIRLGDKARVSIDGQKGKTFTGTVVYISPAAEFTPKNVQTQEERTKLVFGVKIEVNNTEGLLKPGLPADATITLSGA